MENTFFLKPQAQNSLNEDFKINGDVLANEILLFENDSLRLELEMKEIINEAILNEASVVLYEADDKVKEKKKGGNLRAFFTAVLEWLKKFVAGIGKFITTTINKIIDKVKSMIDRARKSNLIGDMKVTTKYPSLTTAAGISRLVKSYEGSLKTDSDTGKFSDLLDRMMNAEAKEVKVNSKGVNDVLNELKKSVEAVKAVYTKLQKIALDTSNKVKGVLKDADSSNAQANKIKDLAEMSQKMLGRARMTGGKVTGILNTQISVFGGAKQARLNDESQERTDAEVARRKESIAERAAKTREEKAAKEGKTTRAGGSTVDRTARPAKRSSRRGS